MRETRDLMGMPVRVEIVGGTQADIENVFAYFVAVDKRFSTYKPESEIMQINRGEIAEAEYSDEMREVFSLAEATAKETNGYFSITTPQGPLDPSGLVKGWAIRNAARLVERMGYKNYFLDAGGDIQSSGTDEAGNEWTIGIRNPFTKGEIIKVLRPHGRGVATSGTYIRGQHIYNPYNPEQAIDAIVSMTVVGKDIYEADRFATAAFAMGEEGILFLERLPGIEGYCVAKDGIATMTSGFHSFVAS